MTSDQLLNLLGVISSIAGAFFAWRQCLLAIRAKDEAKNIRDSIRDEKEKSELSSIHSKANAVISRLEKYTFSKKQNTRGLKLESDLPGLISLLNEIKTRYISHIIGLDSQVSEIERHLEISPFDALCVIDKLAKMIRTIDQELTRKSHG